jgi:hypothetical protein
MKKYLSSFQSYQRLPDAEGGKKVVIRVQSSQLPLQLPQLQPQFKHTSNITLYSQCKVDLIGSNLINKTLKPTADVL